ncbi:hydrolase [Streptomyces sp. A012304]|uniref:hydrolase n=1 Tax=Streptomyces sp. A012304 TaxID=375446 RepID=UPI002231F127|nr:hydrolase [Streptomyces sp. A012304]GKQ38918.1 hydrogenase expression protein [Streptomyces sp. A012304]
MSLWTSLEPSSATVDPGARTTVRLRVRNTGDVVDEYRFEPVGSVAPWTTVEPPTLRLYPGTTGTVELTFAPPRTPDATAGPNPYAIRVTPTEHPEAVTVPEGNLTVTPFTEVRAELVPPTVKGRFRGRPRLAVDNVGNTRVTASVSGSDTGDRLSYDIQPGSVQIEPGRAVFVDTTLRPRQIIWFGSKEEQPYTLAVRRSGAQPLDVEGTFVQRGLLPRWLATALSVSLALAIAFVMIWLAYKPQVRSLAAEKVAEAEGSTLPPPGPSAPVTSAPPAPSPEAAQPENVPVPDGTEQAGSGDGGGAGAGGGGADEPEKPEEETAATAVQALAARSEGRHICYRAYVADQGWQKPVCDGAEAGTTGKDLPIKALNIAVSGTKGVAGNGAHVVEGWKTGDKWSSAADGIDMYIGSTKEADSPLMGFTIEVRDGSVCQNAHLADKGWMGLGCTKPGEWMFGGSPWEEKRKLEAVRFTV